MTEISIRNKKVLENLNNKLLEIMKDIGIIASYSISPLSKITNLENTSQFKLVKDPDSNSNNDLLINKTLPVPILIKLLTFRYTDKKIEFQGDPLKMMTNKN